MTNNLKSVLKSLDQIEENHLGQLMGGFASISSKGDPRLAQATNNCRKHCGGGGTPNNCQGGNCHAGCGGTK